MYMSFGYQSLLYEYWDKANVLFIKNTTVKYHNKDKTYSLLSRLINLKLMFQIWLWFLLTMNVQLTPF